jgi:hypothetical protein
MQLVIVFVFIGLMFIPAWIRCIHEKKSTPKQAYKSEKFHEIYPEGEIAFDMDEIQDK